jgi:hypothetical protein
MCTTWTDCGPSAPRSRRTEPGQPCRPGHAHRRRPRPPPGPAAPPGCRPNPLGTCPNRACLTCTSPGCMPPGMRSEPCVRRPGRGPIRPRRPPRAPAALPRATRARKRRRVVGAAELAAPAPSFPPRRRTRRDCRAHPPGTRSVPGSPCRRALRGFAQPPARTVGPDRSSGMPPDLPTQPYCQPCRESPCLWRPPPIAPRHTVGKRTGIATDPIASLRVARPDYIRGPRLARRRPSKIAAVWTNEAPDNRPHVPVVRARD